MPFLNRIRLPLYLKTPQFPTEANRFPLSNGEYKTLSVTIRKEYQLVTDYMNEQMHQRLVIALNHDDVSIEGDRYVGGVAVNSEYEITYPDFLDYPLGQAAVKVRVTPFNFTNDNCQTCEQATQLYLVDDDAGAIAQGASAEVNVYLNDNICCFPVVAEIVYINTDYLDTATIDQATGIVTLTAKNPVADVGSIVMATYRVTCPDGVYDEADIYGSISGGSAACEQPSDFDAVDISAAPAPYDVTITWATPAAPPTDGYEWQVYEAADLGTPILSGAVLVNTVTFQVDDSATDYVFFVRSACGEGIFSPYSEVPFTTPSAGASNCGLFHITANDGTFGGDIYSYTFLDCDGILRTRFIPNLSERDNCMLMDEFNVPLYFEANDPGVTYTYTSIC